MKHSPPNQEFIEKICEANKVILSPFITENEEIFFASFDGSIYKYKDANLISLIEVGGQPNGLVIDKNGVAYIADMAHQSIISKKIDEKTEGINQIVKDFEGEPLLGPNSLCISDSCSFLKIKSLFQ